MWSEVIVVLAVVFLIAAVLIVLRRLVRKGTR